MRDGYVYVAQAIGKSTIPGWIKIGWAKDIARRLVDVASVCGTDLTLLGCLRGTQAEERALQLQFADQRIGLDWFAPDGALRAFALTLPSPVLISLVACSGAPRDIRGRVARASAGRRGPRISLASSA